MANKTDERLLDSFAEAAGMQTSNVDNTESVADGITGALKDPARAGMTPGVAEMTPAPNQAQAGSNLYGESGSAAGVSVPSESETPTGGSTGSTIGSIATTFLESGLGIVPLLSGLMGLFGGGSSAPPALEKYTMPSAISFESADTGSGLSAADFDQMGTPRLVGSMADSPGMASGGVTTSAGSGSQGGGTSGSGTSAAMPQISVNVQTMDAQSFMDNSNQIAQAVRSAMLNLSSINDVFNDL
jgi:hypothetical protein